jgi:hypothetical protein
MSQETLNARIESTSLGTADVGLLTAWLYLDFGGSGGQGFGGYYLDAYAAETDGRAPSPACGLFIQRVLETVGVDRWEKLAGQHVRVRGDRDKLVAIGHILKNEWFYPAEELKALVATGGAAREAKAAAPATPFFDKAGQEALF